VSDVTSEVDFWPFWLRLLGPGTKPLDGGISLNFFIGN